MTDFVTQYPALVRKLVLLAEDSGKDASAREQWQLCIAATPERDVSRQQSYHSLRAKAEYGLGELAAARADTELAHAPDPVKAGGLGVIVPSSPTLWASSTASYQGDVQLEMLGSVADRFDDFQLRVSGELCGLRDRVRSLEDRAPSLEDRRRSLEEGSMQSSQEGSMPSSLQGSLHSSPQTSPAATRQNSSSAQSLIPHTDRSGVDALPEPAGYCQRLFASREATRLLMETALMELVCYHRGILKYITPPLLRTQLDKDGSCNNRDVLANWVSAELHALADDEAAWKGVDA